MAKSLALVVNPGSASRKYALFHGTTELASLHFEHRKSSIISTLHIPSESKPITVNVALASLSEALQHVTTIFYAYGILPSTAAIDKIGLRIVAPGAYFLADRNIDAEFIHVLEAAHSHAPLHVAATLEELHELKRQFPSVDIVGVSDSAFHSTKPDYAWNYGISLEVADTYDIKRFGYHGLSCASVVHALRKLKKLPRKMVVCHIGSGVSVSALYGGKSIDTTMGYSPLEGLIMSTRSGTIDFTAARVLKEKLNLNDQELEEYLHTKSGLQGLGGAGDLRELLHREASQDHAAHLAITTYVYAIQKAIGQMTAVLGGIDSLVFTGTVGERSEEIRERIVDRLHYLDLIIDSKINKASVEVNEPITIHTLTQSKPIFIVPAHEDLQIARHMAAVRP